MLISSNKWFNERAQFLNLVVCIRRAWITPGLCHSYIIMMCQCFSLHIRHADILSTSFLVQLLWISRLGGLPSQSDLEKVLHLLQVRLVLIHSVHSSKTLWPPLVSNRAVKTPEKPFSSLGSSAGVFLSLRGYGWTLKVTRLLQPGPPMVTTKAFNQILQIILKKQGFN